MTEDRIRELFREMRDGPVPADSLARVRLAVAERTQAWSLARRFDWRWRIAAALLATACVVLVILLSRPRERVAPPASPAAARQQTAPVQPATPAVRAHRATAPAVRQAAKSAPPTKRAPRPGDGLLIRIETPDPDVVILLVGDGEGL